MKRPTILKLTTVIAPTTILEGEIKYEASIGLRTARNISNGLTKRRKLGR